jgi:hypothetical protein
MLQASTPTWHMPLLHTFGGWQSSEVVQIAGGVLQVPEPSVMTRGPGLGLGQGISVVEQNALMPQSMLFTHPWLPLLELAVVAPVVDALVVEPSVVVAVEPVVCWPPPLPVVVPPLPLSTEPHALTSAIDAAEPTRIRASIITSPRISAILRTPRLRVQQATGTSRVRQRTARRGMVTGSVAPEFAEEERRAFQVPGP